MIIKSRMWVKLIDASKTMISRSFLLIIVPTFISGLQQGGRLSLDIYISAEQMFPKEAANLGKDEPMAVYPLHERKMPYAND